LSIKEDPIKRELQNLKDIKEDALTKIKKAKENAVNNAKDDTDVGKLENAIEQNAEEVKKQVNGGTMKLIYIWGWLCRAIIIFLYNQFWPNSENDFLSYNYNSIINFPIIKIGNETDTELMMQKTVI
jgi:uncharacterized protein YheU (UPF0270 family)